MKHRSTHHRTAHLSGATVLLLLSASAPAMEIVAASLGGCGTSASYVTIGMFDPAASRPVGGKSMTSSPGQLASMFQPSLAAMPKTHLVATVSGILTLMAIPDVPGSF